MEKTTLEKINRFTRRELGEDEVYTFSVILCDNDIDRDLERFSDEALVTLAEKFIGRTGISDHDPSSANQTARIFDTQIMTDESRTTAYGAPYRYLNGGKQITTLTSRGFTSLLCQNQIEPGMKTGVSINSLMDGLYSLPYVEHEDNSDTSNYIFVKNNSTMWDALANLSYKLCGTYPYIRGTNTVRITPMSTPKSYTYSTSDLLTMGEEFTFRRLISDFHMADINGDHGTYSLSDSDVSARGIVRHKYFELDRQFLYDPQQALEYRDKYAYRGFKRSFCSYRGYNGEELSDIVTFGKIKSARIGCVEITGSQKGVITEISTYNDKFT